MRYVKALVISSSDDPDLVALRADVLARSGSVYFRYTSVRALSVLLPAHQMINLAARSDVQSVSPNRLTARTSSALELITGTLNCGVRSCSSATNFTGLDGTGIGIAVLDSGIEKHHRNLLATENKSLRVKAAVDFQKTGIAPNADLYDVKVLDFNGFGQLSDVLAGIDWVIYHAKEHNIRVLNLSLVADSTESWPTDPLARAARSAVAAGVTVVVAAGNFGQTASGGELYGTVSSPAHEPSVITFGSVNTKGNTARADDTINLFSSHGPTQGSFVDASGVRRIDDLLKPDLVAPGNKIVGALATEKTGAGGSWNYLANSYGVLSNAYPTPNNDGKTGSFLPTASLSSWLASGSGIVISESGQPNPTNANDASLLGEPWPAGAPG